MSYPPPSYPPPRYLGDDGEISATVRPAARDPELTHESGIGRHA